MHSSTTLPVARVIGAAVFAFSATTAGAQDFDWKKYQGATVTFLVNTNAIGNALMKRKAEFEKLTGITVKIDAYQEQQMRQRLVTVMNARSDEIDLFMSLPSREGLQFAKSGWYADLSGPIQKSSAKGYDFNDFSAVMLKDATYNQQVTGIPLNVEGPVIYYRRDIFQKCGVSMPKTLAELEPVAARLKACDPTMAAFVSRGLKPAVAFSYSVFLHNMGGQYIRNGKSQLCSAEGKSSLDLYAKLLRDYSVPGVINYSFYQISSLYREGRAAMAFESTNELPSLMSGGARLKDTGVALLPPGPGGSKPSVLGWTLSISNYSKSKDAAWLFVQWATNRAMQEKLALEGIAPSRVSVSGSPEYKSWIEQETVRKEWATAVAALAQTGVTEIGYPIVANPASRDPIGQAVGDVLLGQKPVAEACADADKLLDALIAKE